MKENRYILKKTDFFATVDRANAYQVITGSGVLYLVRKDTGTNTPEKQKMICKISEKMTFPAFVSCFEGVSYYFLFVPDQNTNELVLREWVGQCTDLMRFGFLRRIDLFQDGKSYEEILLNCYFQKDAVNLLTIQGNDVFYTHCSTDLFEVLEGNAFVYLVPWSDEAAGQREIVCEVSTGQKIPAFVYQENNSQEWRFAVISKSGTLKLKILEKQNSEKALEDFLQLAGYPTKYETPVNALLEIYRKKTLKDKIFIRQNLENSEKLPQQTASMIRNVFQEDEQDLTQQNKYYKVLAWACKNQEIELATSEKIFKFMNGKQKIPKIQDIARASGLICRSVLLEKNWYRSDCGIIIGEIDKKPVACVPRKIHGYLIYTADGHIQKLTQHIAKTLSPKAYSIGRTLPAEKIKFRQLIAFAKKSFTSQDIFLIILLGILGALIGVLLPTLNQKVYDDYILLGEYHILIQICLLIGTFMVGNLFLSLSKSLLEYRVSTHIAYDLQNALYFRIFQLPQKEIRRCGEADWEQRLQSMEQASRQFVTAILTNGLSAVFSLFYLIRMISYSGKLSIASVLMVLVYAVIICLINTSVIRYEQIIQEKEGIAQSNLTRYLMGIQKLRTTGQEDRFITEYFKPFSNIQMYKIRKNRITLICKNLNENSSYLFSMILYFIIVHKSISVSTGSFIAFHSAFGVFSSAMIELVNGISTVQICKPIYDRICPLLETTPEISDDKEFVTSLSGEIELRDVSFSGDQHMKQILNHISLHINPGDYIAIVGGTGCGKSSLMRLLIGFEKPTSGKIFYDRKDMKDLDLRSLRKNMGVVLQNGEIIPGESIKNNIRITAPDASEQDFKNAVFAAELTETIENLPMHEETLLDGSGKVLSGGQIQRILIARALISHPNILFFDEATSALDNVTQAKVISHLDEMQATRIVVAHRLSTIKKCHRILVLKDGTIAENGSYEELIDKKGLFYQMVNREILDQ